MILVFLLLIWEKAACIYIFFPYLCSLRCLKQLWFYRVIVEKEWLTKDAFGNKSLARLLAACRCWLPGNTQIGTWPGALDI